MLFVAFFLGLLGSFHCIGMCSPITFLLPFNQENEYIKALQVLLYFIGKTLSYCFLGLVFGLLGKGIFISEYQQNFSIFVGVVLFFFGLLSVFRIHFTSWKLPIFSGINGIKKALGKQLRRKNIFSVFVIGFLNGFLPCGLVYAALFGALALANLWDTILYMTFFGVGTSFLMVLFIYLGNFLSLSARDFIQKIIPYTLMLVGILFIIRGLGLGFSFISPTLMDLQIQENPNCAVPMFNFEFLLPKI